MEKRFKILEKITVESAKEFISSHDDYSNNDVYFYTLEPSNDLKYPYSDGWEEVMYYTKCRKPKVKVEGEEIITEEGYIQLGTGPNIIYIMSNSTHNLLKIGSTRGPVEERRKQLSSGTGVPSPFKIEWILKIDGNELHLENEIHRHLEHKRSNVQREFFDIDLKQAVEIIKKVAMNYI
jgi:hypothetical protein